MKVNLPNTSFQLDARSLGALFLAWPRIRTLHLRFHSGDVGARIDLRHVFDVLGPHLKSLHLPALYTLEEIGTEFALPDVKTRLVALSSDRLSLGHSIIDVTWALSQTLVSEVAMPGDHSSPRWMQIYTLMPSLRSGDLYAHAAWLRENKKIVGRHM